MLQLALAAFAPASVNDSLGIYIPLIVVNCILFARIESFASKNRVFLSIVDAFGMGLGFTAGLAAVGIVREFFGSGTFFGIVVLPEPTSHMLIMIMAPGAFFTLGVIIMAIKHFQSAGRRGQ